MVTVYPDFSTIRLQIDALYPIIFFRMIGIVLPRHSVTFAVHIRQFACEDLIVGDSKL